MTKRREDATHILPDDAPGRTTYDLDDLERRFTPGGNVAHLIWGPDWQKPYPHALCGWWGEASYWRGSGTQDEYEKAGELPLCRRCAMWVKQ